MEQEPVIDTARLQLRPADLSDGPHFAALFSDRRVTRHLALEVMSSPVAQVFAEEFIRESQREFSLFGSGAMALALRPAKQVIGYMGLRPAPDKFAELELIFALKPDAWGQGYAKEAAGAITTWGFRRYPDLEQIIALVREENAASRSVLEAAGLGLVGPTDRYYGEKLLLYARRAGTGEPPAS